MKGLFLRRYGNIDISKVRTIEKEDPCGASQAKVTDGGKLIFPLTVGCPVQKIRISTQDQQDNYLIHNNSDHDTLPDSGSESSPVKNNGSFTSTPSPDGPPRPLTAFLDSATGGSTHRRSMDMGSLMSEGGLGSSRSDDATMMMMVEIDDPAGSTTHEVAPRVLFGDDGGKDEHSPTTTPTALPEVSQYFASVTKIDASVTSTTPELNKTPSQKQNISSALHKRRVGYNRLGRRNNRRSSSAPGAGIRNLRKPHALSTSPVKTTAKSAPSNEKSNKGLHLFLKLTERLSITSATSSSAASFDWQDENDPSQAGTSSDEVMLSLSLALDELDHAVVEPENGLDSANHL